MNSGDVKSDAHGVIPSEVEGSPLKTAFEKWQGLGNDFVIVRTGDLPDAEWSEGFVAWCDRRRGVGADGVVVISNESERGFDMVVHNADGSVPEICGNGIRCAVRSWARNIHNATLVVGTGAGAKAARLDATSLVSVEMGPVVVKEPVYADVDGQSVDGVAVDAGNPHLILFGDWPERIPESWASPLEHHPRFPQKTNVSFATRTSAGFRVTVWERGVGFTDACGSAACAVAVASGRHQSRIELPGGNLLIEVTDAGASVTMSGPARHVFDGTI